VSGKMVPTRLAARDTDSEGFYRSWIAGIFCNLLEFRPCHSKSLGLIETKGLIGAVEAADAMVKTANVVSTRHPPPAHRGRKDSSQGQQRPLDGVSAQSGQRPASG
jgi:hypothetical protein